MDGSVHQVDCVVVLHHGAVCVTGGQAGADVSSESGVHHGVEGGTHHTMCSVVVQTSPLSVLSEFLSVEVVLPVPSVTGEEVVDSDDQS